MIHPREFFEALSSRNIGFYTGVPDSLLANFCTYVDDLGGHNKHLITANEGNAIALALGYHMATGKEALVYMQNSGLGNAVNPLTSLADSNVYKVPMLLLIGWRGEPGVDDEPQHIKQGQITLQQLEILGIPQWVIDANSDINEVLNAAFARMRESNSPVALVVRKDTFVEYKSQKINDDKFFLKREMALAELLRLCDDDDLIISTTGKTSREVFEIRADHKQNQCDFLTLGGMGHAASIALGVAIGQPNRRVVCLDGDGSLIMHMGSMSVIATFKPKKFIHVLLNNESHESVGGQATSAQVINFSLLAKAIGYTNYEMVSDLSGLGNAWDRLQNQNGPVLLEVKIKKGSRGNLGRPTTTAEQNKLAFMEKIGD